MINKDELLGKYAQVYSDGANIKHVFRNLLAPLNHFEELERQGLVTPDLEDLKDECLKLIRAYKLLLDDFPEFCEHEMKVEGGETVSKYIREKYFEFRGEILI